MSDTEDRARDAAQDDHAAREERQGWVRIHADELRHQLDEASRDGYAEGYRDGTKDGYDISADQNRPAAAARTENAYEHGLLIWAYRMLEERSYSVGIEMENAMMLDRLKLWLEHGIEA